MERKMQKRNSEGILFRMKAGIGGLLNRINKKWAILAVAVVFIVLIGFGVRAAWPEEDTGVAQGVSHLKELEAKDMAAVEKEVKQVRKEARAEALANGTLPVWAQFSDYIIFGDSRTVGFSYHEFLDEQRILADGGLTIADIPNYMDQMKTLNPSYLFLCTGLNDVSIGYWNTPEEYVTAFEEQMQALMELLPDTQIYINSIFPAQDPAFERSSAWRNIPDYNVAVKAWCEEKGYHYIDNTQVYEEHKDLYDEDGIHFKKEFYEYWAMNMLTEVEM